MPITLFSNNNLESFPGNSFCLQVTIRIISSDSILKYEQNADTSCFCSSLQIYVLEGI